MAPYYCVHNAASQEVKLWLFIDEGVVLVTGLYRPL